MVFLPLKITIYLENGFCHLSNAPFDGMLARLFYEKRLREGTFEGDFDKEMPFLKKTEGVYHTSYPQYKVHALTNITFFKAFDLKTFLKTGTKDKIPAGAINGQSDRYKSFVLDSELIQTEKIEYYVHGDMEYLLELLSDFKSIGKKASLGWGKVSRITLDEIDEDHSLIKDGIPMRNLPDVEMFSKLKHTARAVFPLSPPYWKKKKDISLIYVGERKEDK